MKKIITDISIVSPENISSGEILIEGKYIAGVMPEGYAAMHPEIPSVDGQGCLALPGIIDAHVHFRDPGMTHKGDIASESRAAAAGGVTTVFDMPNNVPPTVTAEALAWKQERAAEVSPIRCSFFIGATKDNMDDPSVYKGACGIKLFMGSSTGNMAVNDSTALKNIFSAKGIRICVHCEDDAIISRNLAKAERKYGKDGIPFSEHPSIRSRQACISSTAAALELAVRYGTALHIAHLSTREEVAMVAQAKKDNPLITCETSPNYLWFDNSRSYAGRQNIYDLLGARVKCNPSIKTARDREALAEAVSNGTIDIIATDHAPHLLQEKSAPYTQAPSGMPSIQHSLQMMLTIADRDRRLDICRIAELMSAAPARIYGLEDRGLIAEGRLADIVLVDPDRYVRVVREIPSVRESGISYSRIAYKCGWSPVEGSLLKGEIAMTMVGGEIVYERERTEI